MSDQLYVQPCRQTSELTVVSFSMYPLEALQLYVSMSRHVHVVRSY